MIEIAFFTVLGVLLAITAIIAADALGEENETEENRSKCDNGKND